MSWAEWTYAEWNTRLLDHHFRAGGDADPVERIPATPEELVIVSGDLSADPASVAKSFVTCIAAKLPRRGRTFCSFCQDYGEWNPSSQEPPHFFAMLWFTCLVAYGYPSSEGAFYSRIELSLGKRDNLQMKGESQRICLPDLWRDLRTWIASRRAAGVPFRELLLPPSVGRRTGIGNSWFLAFPHSLDRIVLAKCLARAGLVGYEPPIQPVVRVLDENRGTFSPEFREDLDDFVKEFVSGSGEPRESAFWRAVRQEALAPSLPKEGGRTGAAVSAALFVVGTDEGFWPLVCCSEDYETPGGYEKRILDQPEGRFTHYLVGPGESLDAPAEDALVRGKLVHVGHRSLVEQGVLVLRERSTDYYSPSTGSEAYGATIALVRADVVPPFCAAFGGWTAPSLVDGWFEVQDCRVHRVESLPPGLERVLQLLPTMNPPTLAISGGIRVPGGGFFSFKAFTPRVHAPGAARVVTVDEHGQETPCIRLQSEDGWLLPDSPHPGSGEVVVRATWTVDTAGGKRSRSAESQLRFVDFVLDDRFKPPAAGDYFQEACAAPEIPVIGGAQVPLNIATESVSDSADLLSLEASTRYLGPGLGEMALQPTAKFEWLVTGPKKHPDLLLFIGDPAHPVLPGNCRSPNGGDRKNWRQALSNARVRKVRTAEGRYADVAEFPEVAKAYSAFRNHNPTSDAPTCVETRLESMDSVLGWAVAPAKLTAEAVDAVAGLACRRSGLVYNDIRDVLQLLTASTSGLTLMHVLRGWAEGGILDVLRHARTGRLLIVPRRPRLVMVHRGPEVEATVMGLLSTVRRQELKRAIARGTGVRVRELGPPNPWQPPVMRLSGPVAALEEVARVAGLDPSLWLRWPDLAKVPPQFDVDGAYRAIPSGEPPRAYKLNARWDWALLTFRRCTVDAPSTEHIEIERRLHPDGSSVYVVLDHGAAFSWTHLRNWALLVGYDLAGKKPFLLDREGRLTCTGRSPLHLPLPIARLCTLIGAALPGPAMKEGTPEVTEYVYPFGRRLYRLLAGTIPKNWIAPE